MRCASRERVAGTGAAQQVLDRTDRELAVVAGLLDLRERVPASAQPRHDAHVGGSRGRPAEAAHSRDQPPGHPAPDRALRDAGARGDLRERQLAGLARRGHRLARPLRRATRGAMVGGHPVQSLKSPPMSHSAPIHLRPTAPLGRARAAARRPRARARAGPIAAAGAAHVQPPPRTVGLHRRGARTASR